MKKYKFYQGILSNLIIAVMLISLFSFTYISGALKVFSASDSDAIYSGNKENPNITLMFNVYWGTEYIEDILAILDLYKVKTTFFVGGTWVSQNSEVLVNISSKGHEIGNHGYFHKDHKLISQEKNQEEIYLTHEIVKKYILKDMTLFAPPSGSFSANTLKVASNLGYKTIMWTKDTIDWRDKNTALIYQRATKNANNGDLILMHPTKNTVEALSDIIQFYQSNNFKLVTVSENIN